MKHLHQNLGEVTGYWRKCFILTCPCDQPCRMEEAFVSEFRRGGGDSWCKCFIPTRAWHKLAIAVHFPDDFNLADFKSAAIWCRQFNATFGAAALKPQG